MNTETITPCCANCACNDENNDCGHADTATAEYWRENETPDWLTKQTDCARYEPKQDEL